MKQEVIDKAPKDNLARIENGEPLNRLLRKLNEFGLQKEVQKIAFREYMKEYYKKRRERLS